VTVELLRGKVPLSSIRNQLKTSEWKLRRIMVFAKAHPAAPVFWGNWNRSPGTRIRRERLASHEPLWRPVAVAATMTPTQRPACLVPVRSHINIWFLLDLGRYNCLMESFPHDQSNSAPGVVSHLLQQIGEKILKS
jgi:hypothetical protein